MTIKANTPGTSHLQLPCALLLVSSLADSGLRSKGRDLKMKGKHQDEKKSHSENFAPEVQMWRDEQIVQGSRGLRSLGPQRPASMPYQGVVSLPCVRMRGCVVLRGWRRDTLWPESAQAPEPDGSRGRSYGCEGHVRCVKSRHCTGMCACVSRCLYVCLKVCACVKVCVHVREGVCTCEGVCVKVWVRVCRGVCACVCRHNTSASGTWTRWIVDSTRGGC